MSKGHAYIIASEETYEHGDIVFEEGDSGDWIYVILSGSVELSRMVQGHKYVLDVLRSGDIFGELENIAKTKRITAARALDATTLGVIERELIDREFNGLSQQFRNVLETMVARNQKLIERAAKFTERAEPRIQRVLSVTYKHQKAFMQAYTANISSGGLFIKTENFLNPGNQFLLKLQLPNISNPIQLQCEVLWARKKEKSLPNQPPGMGVKFTKISKTDYQILKQYIEDALREEAIEDALREEAGVS